MNASHSPFPIHIDEEKTIQFKKNGYLVIRDSAGAQKCAELCNQIYAHRQREPVIEVRWKDSTFDTFNGSMVDDNFPELRDLYDGQLLGQVSNLLTRPLATISDRRVGISINLTSIGGKFQPHFDRHVMTVILYVNDHFDGGEMMFYPRVRFWLGHPSGSLKGKLQRFLDKLVRSKWYLNHIAKKIVLKPKAGSLLIFEGTRTYHAVTPVTGGDSRVSIQFAYDSPGIEFDVSGYYGK